MSWADLRRGGCLRDQHWIPRYEAGSLPYLFSDLGELTALGEQRRVFFLTSRELPDIQPLAQGKDVRLYRANAGTLARLLALHPARE